MANTGTIAETVDLSDTQIAALASGETSTSLFDERERAAFGVADEVLETCSVADDTVASVRELFSLREVLELLFLIGYFRMICSLMTTLEVEVEPPFGTQILESVSNSSRGRDTIHDRR